jgi:hypothetical protein
MISCATGHSLASEAASAVWSTEIALSHGQSRTSGPGSLTSLLAKPASSTRCYSGALSCFLVCHTPVGRVALSGTYCRISIFTPSRFSDALGATRRFIRAVVLGTMLSATGPLLWSRLTFYRGLSSGMIVLYSVLHCDEVERRTASQTTALQLDSPPENTW